MFCPGVFSRKCRAGAFAVAALLIGGLAEPAGAQQRQESDSETLSIEPVGKVAAPTDVKAAAERIVELTNQFRKEQGPSAVSPDPKLTETAQYFANYMATNDKYGHTADDNSPSERAKQHGYEFCIVTENIAYQYRSTRFSVEELAEAFVEGWKQSPEHRKNMLDNDVAETGVAVAHSADSGHYYAVQMFGRARSASIRFAIANRSGETVNYRLGERDFELPPRYTRTHEQCRPPELVFEGQNASDPKKSVILYPQNGDDFVVAKAAGGEVEVTRKTTAQ